MNALRCAEWRKQAETCRHQMRAIYELARKELRRIRHESAYRDIGLQSARRDRKLARVYRHDAHIYDAMARNAEFSETITREVLDGIRVLYRDADTLALYGIPYGMREGQSPKEIKKAHDTYVSLPYGWYGSPPPKLTGWVWLGTPGWWGSMTRGERALVETYVAKWADQVPQGPYEWCTLAPKSGTVTKKKGRTFAL